MAATIELTHELVNDALGSAVGSRRHAFERRSHQGDPERARIGQFSSFLGRATNGSLP